MRAGFDVREVVAEYGVLRELVFDVAAGEVDLPLDLTGFLNRVIDLSIGSAVATYVQQQALDERRRRSEALAFVTHEMRTPLAAMSSAAELLAGAGHAADPAIVPVLKRGVGRLDRLIRQLLEESRQIHGDLLRSSQPTPMRLYPMVLAILTEQEAAAREAGIALVNEVPEDVVVRADANLLDIVLSNLVKNAIDHSGGGRVMVGVQPLGGHVVCFVEDDGRGIAKEHLQRIFEPYETRQTGGGAGLGLYIARRFVEAAGGTIEASSQGQGARFELTLPVPDAGGAPAGQPAGQPAG